MESISQTSVYVCEDGLQTQAQLILEILEINGSYTLLNFIDNILF